MIPALTPYISRYYDDWRRGSRRWCSFLGILPYADDVLSDVLESLCRRPEAFQLDLLAREQAGERPLLFYVFGALRTEAILYAQKYRVTCSIERFPQLIENDGSDTEMSAEPFAAFREVEAIFRSDDFIDAGLLFDDEKDPYQMNNLPLEENKEIVAELCREMGKELKAIDDPWYKERILSDMIPY